MGSSVIGVSSGGGASASLEQYIPTGATATLVASGYSVSGLYTTSSQTSGTFLLMGQSRSNGPISFRWNSGNDIIYPVNRADYSTNTFYTLITTTTDTSFTISNRSIVARYIGKGLRNDHSNSTYGTYTIGYGNGYFFSAHTPNGGAVGYGTSNNHFKYSTDLINWTSPSNHTSLSDYNFDGLAYLNGVYMVFESRESGSFTPKVFTSTNLTNWSGPYTVNDYTTHNYVSCATYGNGRWVASSREGGSGSSANSKAITISTNLTNWNAATSEISFSSMVYSTVAGYFFASQNGGNNIYYSTNADVWTAATSLTMVNNIDCFRFRSLAYGNSRVVTVTEYGRVYVSTNATTWTQGPDLEDLNVGHSANNQTIFFSTATSKFYGQNHSGGYLVSSTDGTNWISEGIAGSYPVIGYSWGNSEIPNIDSGTYYDSGVRYWGPAQAALTTYRAEPLYFSVYRVTGINSV